MSETLKQRVQDIITNRNEMSSGKSKKWKFTLERGQGQTYRHGEPVLYAHSTYERSSVLHGRPQRVWVEKWDSWEEAREAVAMLKREIGKVFKLTDMGPEGGSTHVDIDVQTMGLSDGPDE